MNLPFFWRKRTWLSYLLFPFSLLFFIVISLRRFLYHYKILKVYRPPVLVLVVGNITVGGNGKTPLVIALAKKCVAAGFQVGIVSRGYGGLVKTTCEVKKGSAARIVGDEPLLIAQKSHQPVFVGRKRVEAVKALLKNYPNTNLIISDDGLQHYALARDIEIVAVAADFGLGNGFLFPAGALREPAFRLQSATLTLQTGMGEHHYGDYALQPVIRGAWSLKDNHWRPLSSFRQQNCYAFTAIARPERFFQTLMTAGICLKKTANLADHATISRQDIQFAVNGLLFVTEKDAVKMDWAKEGTDNIWVVEYEVEIPSQMWQVLQEHLKNKAIIN